MNIDTLSSEVAEPTARILNLINCESGMNMRARSEDIIEKLIGVIRHHHSQQRQIATFVEHHDTLFI